MPIKNRVKLAILSSIVLITSVAYVYEKNAVSVADVAIKQPLIAKVKPEIKTAGQLANNYKSIDKLIAASDVVVLGKFTGNPKIVLPSEGPSLPPRSAENAERAPLDPAVINQILAARDPGHRNMTFMPIQTLKGSTNGAITVGQRGAFTEVYTAPDEGDNFFQAEDTYVLFLKSEPSRSNNFYWITGAVQGAFRVSNGQVISRNVTGEIPEDIGPKIQGESLNNFLQNIQVKIKPLN